MSQCLYCPHKETRHDDTGCAVRGCRCEGYEPVDEDYEEDGEESPEDEDVP